MSSDCASIKSPVSESYCEKTKIKPISGKKESESVVKTLHDTTESQSFVISIDPEPEPIVNATEPEPEPEPEPMVDATEPEPEPEPEPMVDTPVDQFDSPTDQPSESSEPDSHIDHIPEQTEHTP